MAIPQSFLDQLKMSCDIETIVSSYVPLKRAGRTSKGLCPFHSEKTPSFVVYHDSESFYCFGCGAGGDVISFIMRIENLGYIEALKFLADRAGLPFPEEEREDPSLRIKPLIYEINREAAHFYHDQLKSDVGLSGREYLMGERKLSAKTVTKYGLGFAPPGWDNLRNHLRKKGFSDEDMLAAAVVSRGRDGKSVYDTFRNRVIFPIIDIRKNVVGFGGRVMDDAKPKYLNSSDTPVFKKSRNLFSLNFAKNVTDSRLILAEGYMDVIAMNQAGFENVVATLGTALTPDQARLMATYAKEIVIAYDSDGPGRTATNRAVGLLEEAGLKTRILDMKGAKDPDEFIKKYGSERFKMLIDGARNVTEYQLGVIRAKYDLGSDEQRAAYLQEGVSFLASVPSDIEREIYGGRMAQEAGVPREVVKVSIDSVRKKNYARARKKESSDLQSGRLELKMGRKAGDAAEDGLIGCLYYHPDWAGKIIPKVDESALSEETAKIYRLLLEMQRTGGGTLSDLTPKLDEKESGRLAGILARVSDGQLGITPEALGDYLSTIENARLQKTLNGSGEMSLEEAEALAEAIRRKKLKR
ncbi:MAG: DNA primase [Candidatus Faecivivens sp.]|nr:DNA primase [Oscillospiraceae bacterium]MDY2711901.1 DNA primase [Candidatus Faecivivens sp.]